MKQSVMQGWDPEFLLINVRIQKHRLQGCTSLLLVYDVVVNRLITDGCKFIHQPSENRKGGGVAVLHRNGIDVKIKRQGITKSLEYIDCYVTCENRFFELIAIYRPGTNPKDGKAIPIFTFFGDFMEILDSHDTATIVIRVESAENAENAENVNASGFATLFTANTRILLASTDALSNVAKFWLSSPRSTYPVGCCFVR